MTAGWAKAPNHHDPAGVLANSREFLESGLTPVRCNACRSEVRVRKASPIHTSVQWASDPAAGEVGARIDTCPKLRESIEDAVALGRLAVPDA